MPQKRTDSKSEHNAIQYVKYRTRKHHHQKLQRSHQYSSTSN